jgi:hypothetical protein
MIMQIKMHHAITAPRTELCRKLTLNREAAPKRKSLLPKSFSLSVAYFAPFAKRSIWKR